MRSPDINQLELFLEQVIAANDQLSEKTKKKESEIRSGKYKVVYHKNCRAVYSCRTSDIKSTNI